MGDRCRMEVTCREKDRKVFEDLGFSDEYVDDPDNGDGTVTLMDFEANYAHCNDLVRLQDEGIPFVAFNDAGGDYGPGRTACDGKRLVEGPANENNDLVAIVGEEGRPSQDDLENVKKYLEVEKAAYRAMGRKEN